jgi:hypothetical protein
MTQGVKFTDMILVQERCMRCGVKNAFGMLVYSKWCTFPVLFKRKKIVIKQQKHITAQIG